IPFPRNLAHKTRPRSGQMIAYRPVRKMGTTSIRLRKKNSGKEFVLPQTSRFRADNAEAFLPSLEEGLGYGLFPEFMVSDGLQEARLERILPEWEGPVISLYLITPPSPMRPNRVKALIDYLIKAFEHPPWVKTER
ncbi:LysR substrate-binding domain-containing protein, partial [Acetobacter pomorum]